MVRSEDKTRNHRDPMRAQTCVILVMQLDYQLPYKPWHLEIGGKQTAKNSKLALHKALNGPLSRQYWHTKMPNLSPSLSKLDTKTLERAMSEIPAHKWRWVTKQMMGQFAHGKNM